MVLENWTDIIKARLKKNKKTFEKVLTFFDNGVKIITVPSNRQKILK